ncbi:MAG TPA: AMP-binding protein [Terriglobia bacterium]|nr:AMP-binding protein [Terriglobia bacterium]
MSKEQEAGNLSYSHGLGASPLAGLTVGELLDRTAARFPENPALIVRHQNRRYTYHEFLGEVERAAKGLLRLGIQKGERVGLWSTNYAEWVITQFAVAKIGAILVNLNPTYGTVEFEHALQHSGCSTLCLTQGFRGRDYPSVLFEICPEAAHSVPGALESAKLPQLRNLIFIGDSPAPSSMMPWNDLLQMGEGVAADALRERAAMLEFDDHANIQYTSGTTGSPKGVLLSHHNLVNNGLLIGQGMRFTCQDKLCIPVPFYHCFGMVLGNMVCVAHGAAMVIPAEYFDALATLQAIAEERCTAVHGVPTMFIAELEHEHFHEFDLSSLRTGIMAGSPCPIDVMRRVVREMHCSELTIVYGLTETSPGITQTTPDDPLDLRVTTVGKPMAHTEIKIVDPRTGRIVPRGTPGELCARGYAVMKGYYQNAEATRQTLDVDGWLHSGDLATMNENDYCKITGRSKDLIIRGGQNIYPRDIEEFLYTHPAISEVQVIGIPDRRYGEQVMAWVKLKPGATSSAEAIREFCQGSIAHYEVPRYVKFVDSFPITINGKTQKYKMREISIREMGLEEAALIATA